MSLLLTSQNERTPLRAVRRLEPETAKASAIGCRPGSRGLSLIVVAALLVLSPLSRAQNSSDETKGIDSGGYNLHQSIEVGYRSGWINGNSDTYDTFVNLGSGPRLFDYTVDMRSLDHNGFLFDNLNFSNFGYGGDPNDVTRLRVDKNKWYDFRVLFRRDKNFWDYNLLANPLNPSTSSPEVGIATSPHALDLVRRMQDYNLTLLPQSRVRIRLGFSHDRDQGPGFFTTDGGTIAAFNQTYSNTTNAYRLGADFRLLPKTTISFDEFLSYYKQDNVVTDNPQNSGYQLAGGTPVDPGIIWSTNGPVEVLPCAAPIITAPNIFNPNCNGYLSYNQTSRPRTFMPTERLRFQSNYFKNFETSGSLGYSSANNSVTGFNEIVNDYVLRNSSRGSSAGGPADAKRVSVNANWSGVYSVTDKFRILDSFRYDNWRTPGVWDAAETNIFGQMQPGLVGLAQPQALFTAATFLSLCPFPYTAATCPSHTAGSSADIVNGPTSNFLGQNIRSNTFQLQYDLSKRLTFRIGYEYTKRTIADFSSTFYTGETYFPGGTGGNAANFYLAARGACAVVSGSPPPCTENVDPATGQLISLTFSGPAAGNDTSRNISGISENTLVAGFVARPMDSLRITADFQFGYNDYSFTRISPRQVQTYKIHADYKPRAWINLDGAIDIHENRDNVSTVNDLEHDRSYGFVATLMPKSKVYYDLGYTYTDIYTQAQICYYSGSATQNSFCQTGLGYSSTAVPGLGFYSSKQHFAYGDIMWKPAPRVTTGIGYAGTFVGGSTLAIDPLQVPGTLAFNYQKPYARTIFDLGKGFSYRMTWNYYGYNGKGQASNAIAGLAPIPTPDFNGSTLEFALRYAF